MLPSDQTSKLRLAFTAVPTVYVGDTVQLAAHAVASSSAGVIRPSDLIFESGDPAALEVDSAGLAVGKAADTVTVTVRLRFADAPPAVAKVPVLATLQIDSVAPTNRSFYYGDTVTVYGVGLNPATTSLFIGGVAPQLVRFTFVPGSPSGRSSLTVLVPLAPTPARLTARRGETNTTAAATLDIVQHDTLEPNDSVPRSLGTLGSVIRLPWLVLEGTAPGKPAARDWYTFDFAGGDVTLVLKPAGFASVDEIALSFTDALDASGNPLPQGWVESVAGNYCMGTVVGGIHGVVDSQIVAAEDLHAGTYHVMVSTSVPSTEARGYELRIESSYHTALANPAGSHRSGWGAGVGEPHVGNCASPDSLWRYTGNVYFYGDSGSVDNPAQVFWYHYTAIFGSAKYDIQLAPSMNGLGQPVATVDEVAAPVLSILRSNGQHLADLSGFGQFLECLAADSTYLMAMWNASGGTGRYSILITPVTSQPCSPSIRGSPP